MVILCLLLVIFLRHRLVRVNFAIFCQEVFKQNFRPKCVIFFYKKGKSAPKPGDYEFSQTLQKLKAAPHTSFCYFFYIVPSKCLIVHAAFKGIGRQFFRGWGEGGQRKTDRKIAKKDQKLALLSLFQVGGGGGEKKKNQKKKKKPNYPFFFFFFPL